MKIFRMNDCDWWMAPTLEEAKADMMREHGTTESDFEQDPPRELTDAEMDKLQFSDEEHKPMHSFREELRQRVALGQGTQMFASTEY